LKGESMPCSKMINPLGTSVHPTFRTLSLSLVF
jgi:hypothetical protein